MENKDKRKLQGDELTFFYNILYQHESEGNHNGFKLRKLPKNLRQVLCPSAGNISKSNELNKVYFVGKTAADFLRHIRNSFAHCNIQYDKKKNSYVLSDEYRKKCTMYGQIEKEILENIITILNKTRNK